MKSQTKKLINIISGWDNTFKYIDIDSRKVPSKHTKMSKTLYDLSRQNDANLYAIFNAARNSEILKYLSFGETEFESLYRGTPREKYFDGSPILISFQRHSKLMNYLLTETWCSQCTVWLTSSVNLDELAEHLKKFIIVEDDLDIRVLFRFYDPRILSAFLRASTVEEIAFFMKEIHQFILESTAEDIYVYNKNDFFKYSGSSQIIDTEIPIQLPLNMTERHMRAFREEMRTRFVQDAHSFLKKNYPEETAKMSENRLVGLVSLGIDGAKQHQIKRKNDVLKYIQCVLLFGRDFDIGDDIRWAKDIPNNQDLSVSERLEKILSKHDSS